MLTSLRNKILQNLVVTTPKLLAIPSQFVPFSVQQKCLHSIISSIFKEAIEDGDLAFLEGKWLKVTVTDLKLTWFISFDDNIIVKDKAEQTDVSFSATVNDLILVAGRKEDPDTLFFQRRLNIQGDTELGLEVKNLLDNIEFDQLSPLIEKMIVTLSDLVKIGVTKQALPNTEALNIKI